MAATALAALAVGLYFGARLLQDWIDRDRLPGAGAEVPEIRETSFLVRSGSPAPVIDGTLTIDAASGAFEFEGRNGGPQSGVGVVSVDGATTYIRTLDGQWALLTDDASGIRRDVLDVVRYLRDDDTADAILTNRLRRGYVDLVERETEGTGAEELTRYELELNTRGFGNDYPLQWQEFRDEAIPGASEERALPVVIWLDTEDVLVRVRDERTNWSWERLSYSNVPFTPTDPTSPLLGATGG